MPKKQDNAPDFAAQVEDWFRSCLCNTAASRDEALANRLIGLKDRLKAAGPQDGEGAVAFLAEMRGVASLAGPEAAQVVQHAEGELSKLLAGKPTQGD